MANVAGMGKCTIPGEENDYPCGKQIQEGEPIGTVMIGSQALVGHKKCADNFYARKAAAERKVRNSMVKKLNQDGPQGPVDFAHPTDLVQGATTVTTEPKGYDDPRDAAKAAGAHFLGDLPMDATPDDAYRIATGSGEVKDELHDEDAQELEAYRQRLIARRRATETPITHTLTIDLSQVPPEAQMLAINLDLRGLRRD
jgi:hypothetical protein